MGLSIIANLRYLLFPKDLERVAALEKTWNNLPANVRTEQQIAGKYVLTCSATYGVYEACNFSCTACYLGPKANSQSPLPFKEIEKQLVYIREQFGPGSNVQITAGEVTLLPQRELVKIIRCAINLQLSPMLMTHGDVLLHNPHYLHSLIMDGGLDKISIHVDITQRGRLSIPRTNSERKLNQVRDDVAQMLRDARNVTGVKLKAATTMTVNKENLPQIADALEGYINNLDTFRILSLQPQAQTGRTRKDNGVTMDQVWSQLEIFFERELEPSSQFGHKDCTRVSLLASFELGKDRRIFFDAVRKNNNRDIKFINRFFKDFSGSVEAERPLFEIVLKMIGHILRRPVWIPRIIYYIMIRSWQEKRHIIAILKAIFSNSLRIHFFSIVIHAFMNSSELATSYGQERLEACMFKVPVNGKMVSMCEMNGTGLRESTYQ